MNWSVFRQAKALSFLFLCLTLISLILFNWRAVLRSDEARDSLTLYLSAKALAQGENPYSRENLDKHWRVAANGQPLTSYTPPAYPPTSIFLFTPLAKLQWPQTRQCLLLINVTSLLLTLFTLSGQLVGNFWRQWLLWIIGFSWGPWHTGISTANLSLLVIALGLLAWKLSEINRWMCCSFVLLLALLLKPQLGFLFWFYFCLRKQWRLVMTSFATALLILILSFCWLQYQSPGWLANWHEALVLIALPGHENDPTAANHLRNDLLNLQRLLSVVSANTAIINTVILVVMAVFCLYLWRRHRRVELSPPALPTLSLITAAGLLPVYHRYYDASLLLLSVTWAIKFWDGAFAHIARAVFLCCMFFLVPGAAWLAWLTRQGRVSVSLSSHWWWEALVMPHQIWALIAIVFLLSYALQASERKQSILICD